MNLTSVLACEETLDRCIAMTFVQRRAHHPLKADADQLLRAAIATKRLVSFTLDGCLRIAEPHDYGIMNGVGQLFFYQRGGESRSGRPLGWRWGKLSKISEVKILAERFGGPRPAPSGRHIHWDVLIATVSPRPVARPRARPSSGRRKGDHEQS
jgi:hypothetical protein